jgi:predicted nucleic acid-binding protein
VLRDLERGIAELAIDADVWAVSFDLGRSSRAKGSRVPATDILIAACAFHHGAAIETWDSDFDMLNSQSHGNQRVVDLLEQAGSHQLIQRINLPLGP